MTLELNGPGVRRFRLATTRGTVDFQLIVNNHAIVLHREFGIL